MKPRALLIAALLSFAACPALAADGTEKGTFSVLFENDLFYNSDHDDTNGVLLAYTTAPQDTPDWAVRTARLLPFFAQGGDVRTRYALGQDIFTPHDLHLADPPPTDRPYAGFADQFGAVNLSVRF